MGAALDEENATEFSASQIIHQLENDNSENLVPQDTMDVLFESEADLADFRARHAKASAAHKLLSEHHGAAYLGIDAGSTTTKLVLIDDEGNLLFEH